MSQWQLHDLFNFFLNRLITTNFSPVHLGYFYNQFFDLGWLEFL